MIPEKYLGYFLGCVLYQGFRFWRGKSAAECTFDGIVVFVGLCLVMEIFN